MHKSRFAGLIIDCQTDDLDTAEKFWAQALGLEPRRSASADDRNYVTLGTAPADPHIELQKVTHASRVHIDIEADDIDAEVERLEKLGARRLQKVRDWWVLVAPTGHRFCVIPAEREGFDANANTWS